MEDEQMLEPVMGIYEGERERDRERERKLRTYFGKELFKKLN